MQRSSRKTRKPEPPPQPEPRRLGPRPLPLHLLSQAAMLMGSHAVLPFLKNGSLSWKPHLAEEAQALRQSLGGVAAEDFAVAVERESRRRLDEFLTGIELYRAHPYRRTLADPPVVWTQGSMRLLDYGIGGRGAPVLAIPSLINRAYILDLTARRSLMRSLAAQGLRPFLVDWGAPGEAEAGFTLTDYIAGRLDAMLDVVLALTGRRPGVVGYCMGGLLALALAQRRPDDICSLALLATPWDFHAERGAQAALIRSLAKPLGEAMARSGELPVDMLQMLFSTIDPTMVERKFRNFAALKPSSARARDFVAIEDWANDGVPLVAEVARECLFGWYGRNETALGRWRVAGEAIAPQELDLPCFVIIPARDRIVPPPSAFALADLIPKARRKLVSSGHVGMLTGRRARTDVYNNLTKWLILKSDQ